MTRLLLADVQPLEDPEVFGRLYGNASPLRRAAADSFRFRKDKLLSIGAAALLDRGLAAFGLREKDMSYGRNEYGKPFFPDAPGIHFNISHSSTKVAVAFSDSPVGCDIEQIADIDLAVAERFFSRGEYESLMGMPPGERRKAFFRYWTLKESYMKAAGLGLRLPPESFSVYPGQDGRASAGGNLPLKEFELLCPETFEGYECALCRKPEDNVPEICIFTDWNTTSL